MEIDPSGGNITMSGLCLQGFKRHASLTECGETGVAQAMTLYSRRICLLPVILDDGIQSPYGHRLAPVSPFHDQEYPIGAAGWPFFVQVADQLLQAGIRYGNHPPVPSFTFLHRQGALTKVDILKG